MDTPSEFSRCKKWLYDLPICGPICSSIGFCCSFVYKICSSPCNRKNKRAKKIQISPASEAQTQIFNPASLRSDTDAGRGGDSGLHRLQQEKKERESMQIGVALPSPTESPLLTPIGTIHTSDTSSQSSTAVSTPTMSPDARVHQHFLFSGSKSLQIRVSLISGKETQVLSEHDLKVQQDFETLRRMIHPSMEVIKESDASEHHSLSDDGNSRSISPPLVIVSEVGIGERSKVGNPESAADIPGAVFTPDLQSSSKDLLDKEKDEESDALKIIVDVAQGKEERVELLLSGASRGRRKSFTSPHASPEAPASYDREISDSEAASLIKMQTSIGMMSLAAKNRLAMRKRIKDVETIAVSRHSSGEPIDEADLHNSSEKERALLDGDQRSRSEPKTKTTQSDALILHGMRRTTSEPASFHQMKKLESSSPLPVNLHPSLIRRPQNPIR